MNSPKVSTLFRIVAMCTFVWLWSGLIVSAETPAPTAQVPFDYQVMTLKNGMQVITLEDHSCPVAAVQVWYHVGSKNEQPDKRGFAHMFEHMMFRGTDRVQPEQHMELLHRIGGESNAYTSFDNTVYIQDVPSNQVELVFWLESERMAFLKINDENFHTERNVVAEEYRLYREFPYGNVPEELFPQLLRGGTYSWNVIGLLEDLYASTSQDLQHFWNTYYIPNNATLVVVGDINHAEIQRLAEKYFGWIPQYPAPPDLAVKPAPINTQPLKFTVTAENGPAPVIGIGYHTVPRGHPDQLALDMLGTILGGGESSRIYTRLVLKDKSAVVAGAMAMSLEKDGGIGAGAVLNPFSALNPLSKDKEKAFQALREEIERIKQDGPTEQEVLKAKNTALRSAVTSQLAVSRKADVLGDFAVIEQDVSRVNRQFDDIRAITAQDIQRVAQNYFLPEREIEVDIKPSVLGFLKSQLFGKSAPLPVSEATTGQPAETKAAAEPSGKPGLQAIRPKDLSETPPTAPLLNAKFDASVHEMTLANGLKVVVIPNHEVPFVTYKLGLLAGAFADPPEAPGTAAMAAMMLTRGTAAHSYEELSALLETYAINVGGWADLDTASVDASAVTDEAERAMQALAEVVLTPMFPAHQFVILQNQVRTLKAVEEFTPQYQANRELRKRLFGNHPYARMADGELTDLNKITTDGMKQWWQTYVRPDLSVLYVAGDLDETTARQLAEKYFGNWQVASPKPALAVPPLPAPQPTHIYLVDRPGSQAQIRVGQLGITRQHPEYFTVEVLNEVFGGSFESRLNKNIRVKEGLTYGAGGGFRASRFAGQFVASTFTKNASVGEALQIILNEIQGMKDLPPTSEEMSLVQNYLVGSFVLNRETPQSVVYDHWLIDSHNLSKDYLQRYLDGVKAATPENVVQAAQDLLDPQALVIVVVGQADQIQSQLEAIAPVTVVKSGT